jgi:cytochrome b pre-mRNA-processing protein 3
MAFWGLFGQRDAALRREAAGLCRTITRVARQPGFYGPHGVPDSLPGRLELLILHGILVLLRLRTEPADAHLAQLFVDRLFKSFDEGLREAGIGDLSVPKSMRRIAARFYARLKEYEPALAAPNASMLAQALQRHVWDGAITAYGEPLAQYALQALEQLQARPAQLIQELQTWPAAPVPPHPV